MNCSLMLMYLNSLKISERDNALKNNVYLDDLKLVMNTSEEKKNLPFLLKILYSCIQSFKKC